jgi:hypothetical protein
MATTLHTFTRNGFSFTRVRASQWRVEFNGKPFAYVSTAAVIRALAAA